MLFSSFACCARQGQDRAQLYLVGQLAALGVLLMLGGPWLGGWLVEQGTLTATGAGLLSGVSVLLGACSAVAAVLFGLAYWLPGAPETAEGSDSADSPEKVQEGARPYTEDSASNLPSA